MLKYLYKTIIYGVMPQVQLTSLGAFHLYVTACTNKVI